MSSCEIISDANDNSKVEITLYQNGKSTVYNNLSFNLLEGWQKLSLRVLDGKDLNISDIKIDGNSIELLKYTSWFVDEHGKKIQPCTWVGSKKGIWNIILHSKFITLAERTFDSTQMVNFVKDFEDEYKIYIDLGIEDNFKHEFTPLLKQYFLEQSGINYYPKDNLKQLPYIPLNLEFDDEIIFNEIINLEYKQKYLDTAKDWYACRLFNRDLSVNLLGNNLKEWLNANGLIDINHVTVSMVKSGGYINMHRDPPHIFAEGNHYPIHITLFPDQKSMLKVSNAGVMPRCANILNNIGYAHAVINDSDMDRYAIIINARLTDDFILSRMKNIDLWGYHNYS